MIEDGDGYSEDELDVAEKRLGLRLPAALRSGYRILGKRPDLTRNQDDLLTPHQTEVDRTGAVLVFRRECQGVTEWGIPLSALAEADPPVVYRWRRRSAGGPTWSGPRRPGWRW
ncbi:hypothetical protein GCM10010168_74490 [Actinoplanes ianthinogenes]|uniref:Knr4/Smi1-like domain-containing protein n=1 Tax=Actinoplanes ianthinogenes TaxID=122358 RepID=A0ABM7LRB0_9ACTN|nr:hypothetical protein [Actinoplanes ianthinogenes]BCJ41761.1 hypothetical protein Aiant_24180 [Actinoplanes ianthinogenes]GGR44759.1 hypothetical protein GCM10010168_74490 [Actinoplanes ianthinogenes]